MKVYKSPDCYIIDVEIKAAVLTGSGIESYQKDELYGWD